MFKGPFWILTFIAVLGLGYSAGLVIKPRFDQRRVAVQEMEKLKEQKVDDKNRLPAGKRKVRRAPSMDL